MPSAKKYIVSALKHRPTRFVEVLAQEHIIRTLKHSLQRGRIANAYLFSGSRGTGKTTTARLLAKALNCENLQEAEPCNQCSSCLSINQGTNIDMLEIDAASNRGIDEIRELRQNARFSPVNGKYKVYIIDEAHMLTKDANNALLKTLEEPPAQSRFILATTEPDKILPTILSRCQCFQFRRIPTQIIVDHLQKIVSQQDDLDIADPSELDQILYHIARTSQGGLRDALGALDQLLAYCSGKLELAEVQEVLGIIEFDQIDRFVRAIIDHDIHDIFVCIESIVNRGKEIGWFLKECLQFLRNLAVTKVSQKSGELLDLPEDYCKQLQETAKRVTLEHILYITDCFWEAERRMHFSLETRLVFEMAAVKAAKVSQAVKIEDLLQKLSGYSPPRSNTAGFDSSAQSITTQPESLFQNHENPSKHKSTTAEVESAPSPSSESVLTTEKMSPLQEQSTDRETVAQKVKTQNTLPISNDLLSTSWNQILREIEGKNAILAGMLENSVPLEISDSELRISIPSGSSYSLRMLEKPNNRESLTQFVKDSFGRSLKIKFETYDVPSAQNDEQTQTVPQKPQASMRELLQKVEGDTLFSKLMEELPGKITNIRSE